MKKTLFAALAAFAAVSASAAPDLTIVAPADTLNYMLIGIDEYASGNFEYDPEEAEKKLFREGKVTVEVTEPMLFISPEIGQGLFIVPGENLIVTVDGDGKVSASGSELAEAMVAYNSEGDSLQSVLRELSRDDSRFRDVYTEWRTRADRMLPDNLDNLFGVYLLSQATMQGADKYIDRVPAAVAQSYLAPLYQKTRKSVDNHRELQANKARVVEGAIAPDVVLPDLEGKDVKLSSLRGKWVLLDFWGSWCRWCMVGVPQMKENYAKYKDVCEFVGIDCRESKAAWKEAVKANELNWLQLYNEPNDGGKPANVVYGVTGYPTKILIDPQGRIAKICVGEDPEFYNDFDQLMR